MPRTILGEAQIHPAVREKIANYRSDIVKGVLVGGADDLARLIDNGEVRARPQG